MSCDMTPDITCIIDIYIYMIFTSITCKYLVIIGLYIYVVYIFAYAYTYI